jgi:general stress protein 26
MYEIGDELKAFMEAGVAAILGTGDASGRPRVDYGWGTRVRPDGVTVDVFLDTARADRALANVRENPKVALTLADPMTHRSVQLKGVYRETRAASEDDRAWVQQQREAFLTVTTLIGDPPDVIRGLWLDDVVKVAFTVERAFDQTPGPGAGKPL